MDGNSSAQKDFLKSIGLNHVFVRRELAMQLKKPWKDLAELEVSEPAAGGRAGGFTEWWAWLESNQRPTGYEPAALNH